MTSQQIAIAVLRALITLAIVGGAGFVGGCFVGKALDWALDVEGEGE